METEEKIYAPKEERFKAQRVRLRFLEKKYKIDSEAEDMILQLADYMTLSELANMTGIPRTYITKLLEKHNKSIINRPKSPNPVIVWLPRDFYMNVDFIDLTYKSNSLLNKKSGKPSLVDLDAIDKNIGLEYNDNETNHKETK